MARPLSTDLDDPGARPYFLWDEDVTVAELRANLASADPRQRALWMGRVMREARFQDVWKLLCLRDVVALFANIDLYLGRTRAFWHWILDGWRKDGFLPRT
jgi:hypothetical protein